MMAPKAARNVSLVLLGVVALLLKRSYRGPLSLVVHNYAGNFAVSFAVYFLGALAVTRLALPRPAAALFALLAVETFEISNGFGVMTNVFDPVDLLANVAGIGVGFALDQALDRRAARGAS